MIELQTISFKPSQMQYRVLVVTTTFILGIFKIIILKIIFNLTQYSQCSQRNYIDQEICENLSLSQVIFKKRGKSWKFCEFPVIYTFARLFENSCNSNLPYTIQGNIILHYIPPFLKKTLNTKKKIPTPSTYFVQHVLCKNINHYNPIRDFFYNNQQKHSNNNLT